VPRLLELGPHQCRWPLDLDNGEEAEGQFCGERVAVESAPYCPNHMVRAHRRANPYSPKMVQWFKECHRLPWGWDQKAA
jgi:hypothetical protein